MTAEALALIDAFIQDTRNQSLVDTDRVRNLLLDVRLLLMGIAPCPN